MSNKDDYYSLDDLLYALTEDMHGSQSVKQFQKQVDSSVRGTRSAYKQNSSQAKRSAYKMPKPRVKTEFENKYYTSRYEHVVSCLSNLDFTNYDDEKTAGYQQAIEHYLKLIEENKMDFRPVQKSLANDAKTIKVKQKNTSDPYLDGYYDAVLMVQSVIHQSKLERMQELNDYLS